MNGVSTVTQRGQVVIPQSIRQFLGLKTADKLFFRVENGEIVARQVVSLDEAFGMIKTKKVVSKKQHKKAVLQETIKKFANR